MYVILLLAVDNTKECGVSQTANCVFPENGKDSYIKKNNIIIIITFKEEIQLEKAVFSPALLINY